MMEVFICPVESMKNTLSQKATINEEHSFAESDWLYVFNGADAADADTGYKMLSEL